MAGGCIHRPVVAPRLWPRLGGPLSIPLISVLAAVLAACSAEKRYVGPTPPATGSTGISDSRQNLYQANRFEQSEGGRLFRWAGCDGCHTETVTGRANLTDHQWVHGGSTAEIYRTITTGAAGMPAYEGRLTAQQLWQLAGHVQSLPKTKPNVRRRATAALAGEPSGADWRGALR
jgi:mono/diheme cytochrome c family protein